MISSNDNKTRRIDETKKRYGRISSEGERRGVFFQVFSTDVNIIAEWFREYETKVNQESEVGP